MARLQIGPFDFRFTWLQTSHFTVTPETDPSGADVECVRIDLEVSGVVQAAALASPAGASLPSTITNIRDSLMTPRQAVIFRVGDQIVLNSPLTVGPLPALPLPSDVKVGPIVDDARYTPFIGDKTAFLYVRLHTWVSYANCFCTSLRWSITANIDDLGMTTRIIDGRASFRKDALLQATVPAAASGILGLRPLPTNAFPDDFRSLIVPPCGLRMRREGMHVIQNSEGTEVKFSCQDKEVRLGTGALSPVLRIECLPSVGIASSIKDVKSAVEAAWAAIKSIPEKGIIGAGLSSIWSALPTAKASGICRVWGRVNTDLPSLIRVAVAVLLDRFAPARMGLAACCSAWITTNSDTENGPWVETRMEFVGLNAAFLEAIFLGDPSTMLNTGVDIRYPPPDGGGFGGLLASSALTAAQLPFSNNTRGTWTGRLVCQQLLASASPPPAPPDNQLAVDMLAPLK